MGNSIRNNNFATIIFGLLIILFFYQVPNVHAQIAEIDAVGCIGNYEYWELLGTTNYFKTYGQEEFNRLCVSLFEKGIVPQELKGSYENSEAGIQIDIPDKWIGYEIQMDEGTWIFLDREGLDPNNTTWMMFFSIRDISKSNNLDKELSDLTLRNVIDEPSQYNYCSVNPGKIVPDMNAYEKYIKCDKQAGGFLIDMLSYAYLTDRHVISATWVGFIHPDFDKLDAKATFDILSIENQKDISNIFGTSKPAQPIVKTKIPDWIRNNAGWWAGGAIGDKDFVSGIQYLIKEKIMQIPDTVVSDSTETENKSVTDQGYIQVNGKEFFGSSYNPIVVTITGEVEEDQYPIECDFMKPGEYYDEDVRIIVKSDQTFQHEMRFGYFEPGEYTLDCKYKGKDFGSVSFSLAKSSDDKPVEKDSTPEINVPGWIKNNADWWSQGLISDDDFVKGIQYLIEQGIIKV